LSNINHALPFFEVNRRIIISSLHRFAKKTKNKLDDAIANALDIHWPFFVFLSLYIASQFVFIAPGIDKYLNYAILLISTYYVVRAINLVFTTLARHMAGKRDTGDSAALDLILIGGKALVWVLAFAFIISNFGYNISTLLAGLGIGGIAIAFALQNVLADIFASISIYIDKPFKPGDFIIVGNDMGTVKKVGVKSTRITTLEGQELIVSNRELTESRVNNYGKMKRRRVAFIIGVTYQTSLSKMKEIPKLIKGIIDKTKNTTYDRVHWKDYGNSSLNYEIVYYVESSDFALYRDIQQSINLAIKEVFDKKKIEFAYPTQTIFIEK